MVRVIRITSSMECIGVRAKNLPADASSISPRAPGARRDEFAEGTLWNSAKPCYHVTESILLDERRLPWAHRSRGSGTPSRMGRS